MTTCLPVYSHILRPALMIEKQLRFDEVNNVFNLLVANAQVLAEYSGAERTDANVNAVLWRIQEHANEILDHVMKVLSGKGGYLRSSLLGLRVNFSARAVIIPLPPGHEQDEVHIPYLAFLELYRFQLTNLLARTRGIGIREANELWHRAQTRPDRTVLAAMREMISRAGGLFCLLNRNPTINFGSILRMRITGVLVDPGNLCFRLPNMVLRSISGDFDGDVVSLLPLLDEDTSNAFACFDPRLMYTSRDQLGLNRTMRLDKDHVLGLSVLTEDPPILHDFSN